MKTTNLLEGSVALAILLFTACGAAPERASEPALGPAPGPAPAIESMASAANPGATQRRPCRDDLFFVEVPLDATPAWTAWSFLDQPSSNADLRGDLEAAAAGSWWSAYKWFCSTSACRSQLAATGVYAELQPVLPQLSVPGRTDGHLRFLRLRFRKGSATGDVLPTIAPAQCDVVQTLRARFAARAGVAPATVRVGRDCDAVAMGAEGTPLDLTAYPDALEMRDWHLRRIGVDPASAGLGVPPARQDVVDVSLIDAGIAEPVATALGVATQWSAPDLGGTDPALHRHGAAMALLVRQVAPLARLHSFRMMEKNGHGTTRDLARAIDAAVHRETDRFRVQVLSLSLGYPSELGQPAILQGQGGCSTTEDGIGESVRYALDQARRREEAGQPFFVAAAAGNRTALPPQASLFQLSPSLPPPPECGAVPSAARWSFPAEWSARPSCRAGDPQPRTLTFATSAVTTRDAASGISALAEPPFVAPGEHVYVWHPSAAPTPATVSCAPAAADPSLRLPASLTGSSVASALTAAAVARVQGTRVLAAQPPLPRDAIERLLYLTGHDTCRSTDRYPIRRLSLTRLEAGLGCASLVACASGSTTPLAEGEALLTQCRQPLASCGLEVLSPGGATIQRPCPSVTVPRPVTWPRNYGPVHDAQSCAPLVGSAPAQTTCSAPPCGWELHPTRTLLGSTGPQPKDPACPDCRVTRSPATAALSLELYSGFPEGTTFSSPYLAVTAATGQEYWIALPTQGPSWSPGKSLSFDLELTGAVAQEVWAKAALSLTVTDADGTAAVDFSPLRLETP